jgi:hypothetical protein
MNRFDNRLRTGAGIGIAALGLLGGVPARVRLYLAASSLAGLNGSNADLRYLRTGGGGPPG